MALLARDVALTEMPNGKLMVRSKRTEEIRTAEILRQRMLLKRFEPKTASPRSREGTGFPSSLK